MRPAKKQKQKLYTERKEWNAKGYNKKNRQVMRKHT